MPDTVLAIDFGTSNSAVAILDGGQVRRIPVQPGSHTLPTAVFFPARSGAMRIGDAAAEALTAGEEGRYMRALKSVLGTPLLHETRLVGGRRRSMSDVITEFLTELRQRTEAVTGRSHSRALSGRPVRFHPDPVRDARAEANLRDCYYAAGFSEVTFMPEPEAAALACHGIGGADRTGLIVDIGGGTSDFSVYRTDGGKMRILASHGIRLGGTDFDQAVSLAHAMPLLGHGSQVRREMGAGLLPVPNAIYADLSGWATIPFAYTPESNRLAKRLARLAVEPTLLGRLATVLRDELGHELAFAVEGGKIAANTGAEGRIEMSFIESSLAAAVTPTLLRDTLQDHAMELDDAIVQTLDLAEVGVGDIASVILVGGSSLMHLVIDLVARRLPNARLHKSDAFTAVVDGLALATAAE